MSVRETQTQPDSQERELVCAAQSGDRSAFRSLYEQYRDSMYNLIFYTVGDAAWAEDILQIVFLKAYQGLNGFRLEAGFSTWIYRIAVNECKNQMRGRKTRHVPLEEVMGSSDDVAADSQPDRLQRERQRREVVHQAVLELSPKLRAVVALKYFEELSYEEIASVLDCSPGTVASRMNRALSKMEQRLRPLKPLL